MPAVKKLTPLFAFLLIWNTLPAQYTRVFSLPFPAQYGALDSIKEKLTGKDTAGAGRAVKEMEAAADQTGNEQTILNYKRFLLDYNYIQSRDNHDTTVLNAIIRNANNLLKTVDEKKYPEIAAMVHVTLGNTYYYKVLHYNLAFAHFIKAYDLFKTVSTKTFPDRQYAQYAIALAYYQFNDYENALRLSKEIEAVYPVKNKVSLFTVQMMGMCYEKMKQYDSALPCFRWVRNHTALAEKPAAWKGIALGSIGDVYFWKGDYEEAIPYLDSGIAYTVANNIPDNSADFAAHLCAIYLQQQNMPLAKKYAEIAQQAAYRANDLVDYCTVYESVSGYYKATGNTAMALQYLDSFVFCKDSLTRIHDIKLRYQGEIAVEKERTSQQQKLFEQEKSRQLLMRNSLVALIILSMLVVLLVYNSSRMKSRHREAQLLLEKQQAEAGMRMASDKLTDFTKSIVEKNELIEKVTQEIERLHTVNEQLQNQQVTPPAAVQGQSLKLLQESVLLTDEHWRKFASLFDQVHDGFFTRLKEKLPGLSPAETRFMTLLKLKLGNKEMAAMLGVGTDAIRQTKSRLKRKLNITDDNALESAVETI